jgi:hypothetical protein
MGYAVYLDRLAFQRTDAQGLPVGDEEIVTKGQPVPDYVRPFQLAALRSAGAIVDMGPEFDDDEAREQARRGLNALGETAPALPNPEVPPTLAGNAVLHSLFDGPEGLEEREGSSVPAESRRESRTARAERDKAVHEDEPQSPQPGSGTPAKSPARTTGKDSSK